MFTGIIQAVGSIESVQTQAGDARFVIATGELDLSDVVLGDSIAVNGVCLTVVELTGNSFNADVSSETLSKTTLATARARDAVNLEKALTPTTRLGGHLVSGHVDGIGTIVHREQAARSEHFRIEAPSVLAKYIAQKGSICVDGISLTVNAIEGAIFDLNIVPHTLSVTNMDQRQPGDKVNLEVDIIARYLERLLLGERAATADSSTLDRNFLAEHGFIK